MSKNEKKSPEKILENLLAGVQTWDTEEFESCFLASACFLLEGETKKGDTEALMKIASSIDDDWFTEVHRKALFYVIKKVFIGTGQTQFLLPGSIAVMAERVLKFRGHEKECQFINTVINSPSIFYSVESFETILPVWRLKLIRRKMIQNSEELLDIFNSPPDVDTILDKVPRLIESQHDTWNNISLINQKEDDWASSVDELLSPVPEGIAISTGLEVLDDAIQGGIASRNSPYSGRLIVVAARPAMGKSTIAISLATHLADSAGDVAFFSLEMSKRQVQYKAISCYDYLNLSMSNNLTNPIRSHNLRQRVYTTDQRERLQSYRNCPFVNRFHIYDASSESIAGISAKVTLLAKTRSKLSAVFIDYLQLIEGCSGDANNTEASNIGHVTRALKQLAVRTGIDIFLLSQVNRGVESRTDKMPTLSDLRASGRIEEDADIVMFLLRPSYYNQEKDPYELAISVAKNRHGVCGTLRCGIDLQSSVVFDEKLKRLND
jgi:replicative DNA helicase